MTLDLRLALLATAGLAGVIELVRRRRLREEFSWLWSLAFAALLALALVPGARARLSSWLGTGGESGAVVMVALAFLAALALDFSIRVSRLATQQKNLAQELALLRRRLEELEGRRRGDP